MWDFLLTVSWGPVSSFESGTGWFWWSVVCICVEWIEASRSNSHQSVPELSRNFYSVSPTRAQKHLLAHPCRCFLTCTNQNSPDLFPKLGRECCSLDHLHVEETLTCKNKSVVTQLRLVDAASCCVPHLSPPWWWRTDCWPVDRRSGYTFQWCCIHSDRNSGSWSWWQRQDR